MVNDKVEDHPTDTQPQSDQYTTSPPSPDAIQNPNQRISRKRERTVSLEPSTPKPDDDDANGQFQNNNSGHRSPKKKNRIRLESTEEEASTSRSRTPSPSPSSSQPSPPHEVKVRQISQGVEDISWRRSNMAAATSDEKNCATESDAVDPATPIAVSEDVPTAPASPVGVDATEVSPEYRIKKSHARSTSSASGSDSTDPDKSLKRKLADRGTSHGPENRDAAKATEDNETSKRAREEDDNFRAKKRPTPPSTPEATSALDEGKKITPPATPPSDNDELPKPTEPSKRPRDDADKDANPRQTKKPSPPPEKTLHAELSTSTPKLSGFMAYASTSSPFASVKGQNIFGSSSKPTSFSKGPSPSPSPSPANSQLSRFPTVSALTSPLGDPSTLAPTATKRTGFEAFSGSTPPFASAVRSKSPAGQGLNALRSKSPGRRAASKNTSAFSSYASGGAQAFAVPVPKRARAGTPDGKTSSFSPGSLERNSTLSVLGNKDDDEDLDRRRDEGQLSFGEKLRAGKDVEEEPSDEEAKPELIAQAVHTGEEDENIMYMVRAKLFRLSEQNQWKERGTGTLKLNVRKTDGEGARLVMRKEAVFTVLLNVTLFHGMSVNATQDPRYVRISVIENGATVHYNLRVASAKIGEELLDAIKAYIPPPPSA